MKCVLLALSLVATVAATPLLPIPVNGTGTFHTSLDPAGNSFLSNFSGSLGARSISVGVDCGYTNFPLSNACFSLTKGKDFGSVAIDGVSFLPGYFYFNFNSGAIVGLDANFAPVISETFDGPSTVTSTVCNLNECSGTFSVTPVPEPGTWVVGLGLTLVAWRRR